MRPTIIGNVEAVTALGQAYSGWTLSTIELMFPCVRSDRGGLLLHFSTARIRFADFRHDFFQIFFLRIFAPRVDFTLKSSIEAERKVGKLPFPDTSCCRHAPRIGTLSVDMRPQNGTLATI